MSDPRPDWVLRRRQEIGHYIAQQRAARGMSIDDLAEAAGVHRLTVMRAEHGSRSCGLDVLLQLAAGLGMPLWEMLRDPAAGTGAAGDGA